MIQRLRPYTLDIFSLFFIIIAIVTFTFTLTFADYLGQEYTTKLFIALSFLSIGLGLGNYTIDWYMSQEEWMQWADYTAIAFVGAVMAQVSVTTTAKLMGMSLLSASAFAVMMAVSEEAFFRGALQQYLKAFVGPWGAIAVASFAWSLYHYAVYHSYPYLFVVIFISGIIFGYTVEKTNRLSPAMMAHAVVNFIATMVGGM